MLTTIAILIHLKTIDFGAQQTPLPVWCLTEAQTFDIMAESPPCFL